MIQQFTQQVCDECPNVKLERRREPLTIIVEPGMAEGHACAARRTPCSSAPATTS